MRVGEKDEIAEVEGRRNGEGKREKEKEEGGVGNSPAGTDCLAVTEHWSDCVYEPK